MRGKAGMFIGRPAVLLSSTDPYFSNVSLLLHFDGNATDSSTLANTVALTGASATGTARFGSASLSAGSDQYASVSGSASLAFASTDDFTVELWVKASAGLFDLFSWNNGSGTTWGLYSDNFDGVIRFSPSGDSALSGSATLNDNEWHHVALSRASGTGRIHVDGIKVAEGSLSIADTTGYDFFIGVGILQFDGSFGSSKLIDELRFTKGYSRYGSADFTPATAAFPNS